MDHGAGNYHAVWLSTSGSRNKKQEGLAQFGKFQRGSRRHSKHRKNMLCEITKFGCCRKGEGGGAARGMCKPPPVEGCRSWAVSCGNKGIISHKKAAWLD